MVGQEIEDAGVVLIRVKPFANYLEILDVLDMAVGRGEGVELDGWELDRDES